MGPPSAARAPFIAGVVAGVAASWLAAALLPQETPGHPPPPGGGAAARPADRAAPPPLPALAPGDAAPAWLLRARELYGPYARLAEGSWRDRVWLVPEERRAAVAQAKRDLVARFRQRNTARDAVGDFETLWHFGLMAPKGAQLVEVGTCKGGGAMTIATAMKAAGNGAKLLSADLYEHGWLVRMGYCFSIEQWKKLAEFHEVADVAEPRGYCSAEVAHSLADGSIDGVFVDAEHHFDEVVNDISRWWPKLRGDGLMIGHDAFTHVGNAIALADAVATTDPGQIKLLRKVGTFDTLFKAQGAASSGAGYGDCPQGAHVSLAALRYAHERMQMEFACCMPNSSIWHFKRYYTPDLPRLSEPDGGRGFIPAEGAALPSPPLRPAFDGPAPVCPVDPMQKKRLKKR
eukprot:TRINITY_DN4457_c1_g2_i1.p1 TRINITY_DN4457_c1_g2~~TRINITY_DN4457_c1_g2_i1.p1  ORF type:complete len:430 (+),score=121.38 TRINITY_DN4457_c1_g2_i1:84-1292(+)